MASFGVILPFVVYFCEDRSDGARTANHVAWLREDEFLQ
jgi:hypothetical protein